MYVVVREEALALAELDQLLFGFAVCFRTRGRREGGRAFFVFVFFVVLVTRRSLGGGRLRRRSLALGFGGRGLLGSGSDRLLWRVRLFRSHSEPRYACSRSRARRAFS